MYRRIGLALGVVGAVSALAVSKVMTQHLLGCDSCTIDAPLLRDFLLGGGVVAGLYGGLAWLETAPLRQVATHLSGLGLALAAVFTLGS